MSSARKTSPRLQHRNLQTLPSTKSSSPLMLSKGRRGSDRPTGTERCRGRCRVQWSEKHVKEGLVLVKEDQLARVVKTGPISEYYEIDPKPFASGQWARVYRCRSRSTGVQYAAKYSSRNRFNADCSAELRHEIALLSLCSQSPRVVRLHDVYETPKEIILVMEYAPGGDLQTLIDGDLVPLEGDVVHFVRQLVEGLAYLHERNIAHLDIKPQNLVMMGTFPECDVKLCDFEISRVVLEGTEIREILGTPDYVAPEILHYEPITLAADIWSLGVTTYVLLTGFSPFGGETDQETFQNISLGEVDFPEELFEDVSTQAKDFVSKLLVQDPSARMTAKQCLRHDWLRGAPTQASPHLRRYLSKSREVLLERVVSRENLRRAALLCQAKSHANLSETNGNERLGSNLSQSEMCLSYGLTGSRMSLPGSEECLSPADSQTSLDLSQNSFALSQSCLLNKEQTQGLLNRAQSRSQANLNHGPNRGLLSRMRTLNQTQSQACLLNSAMNATLQKHVMNPLFSRSRDKLYGLKSLSKSQDMLDIYRSLECLKRRRNQRAKTEDMLPIFKQLSVEIFDASIASVDLNVDLKTNETGPSSSGPEESLEKVSSSEREKLEVEKSDNSGLAPLIQYEEINGKNFGLVRVIDAEEKILGKEREMEETKMSKKSDRKSEDLEVLKGLSYESEENLDSLQSIESDTLTEDSDEIPVDQKTLLSVKQPSQRQHSDISSHSNNSANSDEKDEHSESSENEEPKYTVAQLVSAFNKHQEVASKTSLEAIMSEKRINEVTFPTGPKALRLFIPDINITESSIVRRKTSYKPRKNWEELRKRSEKNEGILKDFDNDSGNEEDEDGVEGNDRTADEDRDVLESKKNLANEEKKSECSNENNKVNANVVEELKLVEGYEENYEEATSLLQENVDVKIDEKYKQCVEGAKLSKTEACTMESSIKEKSSKTTSTTTFRQAKGVSSSPKERLANYIFPEVIIDSRKEEKQEAASRTDNNYSEHQRADSKVTRKERTKALLKTDSSVNLKDILQKVGNGQTSPKENLENLRKRTSITKIILNDNLIVDNDTNNNSSSGNNGASSSIHRARSEPPSSVMSKENERMKLDIPPSFIRSSSLSSEGSCPTPSSVQSDIGMSWEDDVQGTRGSSQSLQEKEDVRLQKRTPAWEIQRSESQKVSNEGSKTSTMSFEERKRWGKICIGSYTRAMERFNGKSAEVNRKSINLLTAPQQTEKTRRKSSPAMPQFINP